MMFNYEQFSADILASRADLGLIFLTEAGTVVHAEHRQKAISYAHEIRSEIERVLMTQSHRVADQTRLRTRLESLNWKLAAARRYSSDS